MDDLLIRIEKLEQTIIGMRKYLKLHHDGEVEACDSCRILQGKPVLIKGNQVSRLFGCMNMLKLYDEKRKKVYISNVFNLCGVSQFQDITTEQWPEVEKIVIEIEQEMKELGIEPPKKAWNKK